MFNQTKKLITVLVLSAMLLMQNAPLVLALEAPASPETPITPETATVTPEAPTTPSTEVTPTTAPEAVATPAAPDTTMDPVATPAAPSAPDFSREEEDRVEDAHEDYVYSNGTTSPTSGSTTAGATEGSGTGSQIQTGGSGSVSLTTGDANSVANISTSANNNVSLAPVSGSGGSTVVNSGNGTDSNNSGTSITSNTNNNNQTNSAVVGNNLNNYSESGSNILSENTGGDVNMSTGDSNTSGTIVNTVNTNLNGVAVYEFNIADDQLGDYILNFDPSNCLSGCGGSTEAVNSGNGAESDNQVNSENSNTTNNNQTNTLEMENNLNLGANSGDNLSMKNTGGDTNITTGNANVQGSVLNFANNNIEGGVVYAVVNVYGDLTGDIILPESSLLGCCGVNTTAKNSGNGADSNNAANTTTQNTENINQFNNVDIENNLVFEAETGDNIADKNTDGDVNIDSGDTNVVAQVLNVANTNIIGGNWWLVIVNEAGKWIGRIVGSPDDQNYAGSEGFEITVDEAGGVSAMNAGNGADSKNSANASSETTTTTTQTNDANIVNNVNLSANTGGNNASKNTGGDSSVVTGDANIIANIVNFVNNNIVGDGKLIVTVINVFGSWLGDFVAPGQSKENKAENNPGIGGVTQEETVFKQDDETTTETVLSTNTTGGKQSKQLASYANTKVTADYNDEDGDNSLVLGVNSDDTDGGTGGTSNGEMVAAAGKKVVRINLAWFTPLLPLGLYYILKKRKFTLLGSSARVKLS